MSLLPDGVPLSKFRRGMVEKLVAAAAIAIAGSVVLASGHTRLWKKAMTTDDGQKNKKQEVPVGG